jgi:hypothetical protein
MELTRLDNFKPAAIDYSLPGTLTTAEDGSGDVSLALPSTQVIGFGMLLMAGG